MERASRLIRGLAFAADSLTADSLVTAAWPDAVGKKIAAHTRATRLVRKRLVVEVEDATWQRQLFALTTHILKNLEKSIGGGVVEDIEFRVMPRRMEPQRAMRSARHAAPDEADGIADPVLRRIYRKYRLKAGA